jgi:hypothetical protein
MGAFARDQALNRKRAAALKAAALRLRLPDLHGPSAKPKKLPR